MCRMRITGLGLQQKNETSHIDPRGRQQGRREKFELSKFIWFPSHCPKMTSCLLRALHQKLPTKDKLMKIGVVNQNVCSLCQQYPESVPHLFFECGYSKYIWAVCRIELGLNQHGGNLEEDAMALMYKFNTKTRCSAIA